MDVQSVRPVSAALTLIALAGCHRADRATTPDRAHDGSHAQAPAAAPPRTENTADTRDAALDDASGASTQLAIFPAPPYVYELAVMRGAPAQDEAQEIQALPDSDPFVVRLLRGGRVLDEVVLSQSSCGHGSVQPAPRIRGADRESKAWVTSADQCEIGVSARTVAFGARIGLLVTQNLGFEYLYSKHFLLLAQDDQLRRVWTYDESNTGEEHTDTSVVPGAQADRQDVAFVRAQRTAQGLATKIKATRLSFDDATGEMVEGPLPDREVSLHLLVLGDFKSKQAALQQDLRCLRQLDLMQGALFPVLRTPAFYFGRVFTRRADAEGAAADARRCSDLQENEILELRSK
jgi:hypothetical protein